MSVLYLRDQITLFVGDFIVFVAALWLTLLIRHFETPSEYSLLLHVGPFSFLALLWITVFVIVGLYDRHIALFEHRLAATITEAQIINMLIAAAFFFIVPVRIQPMTVLIMYFVVSTVLIVVWRLVIFKRHPRADDIEPVIVVGSGTDIDDLVREIGERPGTHLSVTSYIQTDTLSSQDAEREVEKAVGSMQAATFIIDPRILSKSELFKKVSQFDIIDASDVYEAVFSRVALSLIDRGQLVRASESRESKIYDVLKRIMDVIIASVLGFVSLTVYPFVWLAILIEDGGSFFVRQVRVGKRGAHFDLIKFRSMSGDDGGNYEGGKTKLVVTKVGNFLRKSRIDELPQLWSVVLGAQSLVGPRPELPPLVALYNEKIPHYDLRHLVQPGLSGWAQLYDQSHPHGESDTDATRRKLSYDLYYVKHRSLILDLDIALKTIKILALRLGA